jgi:hypothetical protein
MKPAICLLCGKSATEEPLASKGDWVRFSEYRPSEATALDHPSGLEYFCAEHVVMARNCSTMRLDDALVDLQKHFGTARSISGKADVAPRSWWRRLFAGG